MAQLDDGSTISARNVIKLYTRYQGVYDENLKQWSINPLLIGNGSAKYYRDGKMWPGHWSKNDLKSRLEFTVDGKPMNFASGNVWVLIEEEPSAEDVSVPSDITPSEAGYAPMVKMILLNIMDKNPGGEFKPEEAITRAEFAKSSIEILGLGEAADLLKNMMTFLDVIPGARGTGYINLATAYGILKGDSKGRFRPYDSINGAEVVTVLLRLLGYNDNLPGRWPTDYVVKAAALGIFENLSFSTSAPVSRRLAAQLISRILEEDIILYDSTTGNFFDDPDRQNFLEENFQAVLLKLHLSFH